MEMTFRQFAFNNVSRNKRLYAAYFLSSMFIVMVFFTFAIFAFHPNLNIAGVGGNFSKGTTLGLSIAGGIIYVFSFFFVLYSMSSFLQSRKREFGLLMMQGMSMRQIRVMVFLENMLIGFFATLSGVLLGLVFAKGILLVAENVLIISEELNFYFPLMAIILTFASFIFLFLFISFLVAFILRSKKLIDLIKGDKQSKGEPKASILLTIIAVLLLGAGYFTALYVKGLEVLMAMVPVIIVVIIGTYLLFTQLSVFIIGKIRKKENVFWRKTNMLLFSDLAFRMKDNARTFFMVAIISTVAFSAIGTLFGFQSYLGKGMKDFNPLTFTYHPMENDDQAKFAKDIEQIEQILAERNLEFAGGNMERHYFSNGDSERSTMIVRQSDYNSFADLTNQQKVHLQDDQAIVVEPSKANMLQDGSENRLMNQPVLLESGETIQPYTSMKTTALSEMNAYYIVSDEVYEQLPPSVDHRIYYGWQAETGQDEKVLEIGEFFTEEVEMKEFFSVDYTLYTINKFYGPIMFVGLFIGIIFFISSGSFLYFRLYTDLDEDKQKFKSIAKMGLTAKELKKVISRQTMILFFAPIIVALLHGAVALTALSHLFNYNLFEESAWVLGSFFAIQLIYFFIVRHFYTKQIKSSVL
jgi:putative ABC transport system permease protein